LAYPTRKVIGKDVGVFYPINRQVGFAIEEAVKQALEEVVSEENGRYGCDYS
jgi:hypothetical protein